jgi:hypothetical protein
VSFRRATGDGVDTEAASQRAFVERRRDASSLDDLPRGEQRRGRAVLPARFHPQGAGTAAWSRAPPAEATSGPPSFFCLFFFSLCFLCKKFCRKLYIIQNFSVSIFLYRIYFLKIRSYIFASKICEQFFC